MTDSVMRFIGGPDVLAMHIISWTVLLLFIGWRVRAYRRKLRVQAEAAVAALEEA